MINLNYLYNPAAAKGLFDQKRFLEKESVFSLIEQGTLLPYKEHFVNGKLTWGKGGIVNSNGDYVKNSYIIYVTDGRYTPPRINSIQLQNGCLSRNAF